MDGLTIYRVASIALFAAAGVLAVTAVVMFFALRIWKVIGRLSGSQRVRGDEREMDWTPGAKNYRAPAVSAPAPAPAPAPWQQGAQNGAQNRGQQRVQPGMQYRGPAAPTGTVPLTAPMQGGPAAPTGTVPLTAPMQGSPAAPTDTVPLTAPMQGGPAAPADTVPLTAPVQEETGHAGGPDGEGTVQLDEELPAGGGDSAEAARRKLGFQPDVKVLVFQSDERI